MAVFLDSEGKSYALPAHSLPSARGQGEPLTSRLKPQEGAFFETVLAGMPDDYVLLASDAGYGFITQTKELYVKNKNGKSVLKLPKNSKVLQPKVINNVEDNYIASVTNDGHLLIFPVADLPKLNRGKGNKIINIPSAKALSREEFVVDVAILGEQDSLIVYSGKRHISLKPKDLVHYQGERGRRGSKLPRGFQKVTYIEAK